MRRSMTWGEAALREQCEARDRLLAAMQASLLWDAAAVLQRLQGSDLFEERILVYQKVGGKSACSLCAGACSCGMLQHKFDFAGTRTCMFHAMCALHG